MLNEGQRMNLVKIKVRYFSGQLNALHVNPSTEAI